MPGKCGVEEGEVMAPSPHAEGEGYQAVWEYRTQRLILDVRDGLN